MKTLKPIKMGLKKISLVQQFNPKTQVGFFKNASFQP